MGEWVNAFRLIQCIALWAIPPPRSVVAFSHSLPCFCCVSGGVLCPKARCSCQVFIPDHNSTTHLPNTSICTSKQLHNTTQLSKQFAFPLPPSLQKPWITPQII